MESNFLSQIPSDHGAQYFVSVCQGVGVTACQGAGVCLKTQEKKFVGLGKADIRRMSYDRSEKTLELKYCSKDCSEWF